MAAILSPLTLVLGGARSGKSRHAEALIEMVPAPWTYLATAQAYVASCVTAIAVAKRHEGRKNVSPTSVDGTWTEAAGRCRGLANTLCNAAALDAPREACNRIRSFDPLL